MEFYKWEGRDVSSAASKGYSWVCSLMAQVSRRTGTVKWFSQQKGFGFITPDAGGDDLFVHQTSIQSDGYRSLSEGEAVEFSVDSGNSGRTKAVDVTGPNGSALAGGGGGGRGYSGVRDRGGSYTGNFGWGKSGGRTYGGGNAGGGSCYNCGKFGHMARDCQEAGRGGGGGGGGGRYGGGRYGGGGNGGGGCYNCGEQGHFARECPNGDSK